MCSFIMYGPLLLFLLPGLYVIDSIVRQSRHQFGSDKVSFPVGIVLLQKYLCGFFGVKRHVIEDTDKHAVFLYRNGMFICKDAHLL